jgi:hypothetical protein
MHFQRLGIATLVATIRTLIRFVIEMNVQMFLDITRHVGVVVVTRVADELVAESIRSGHCDARFTMSNQLVDIAWTKTSTVNTQLI